MREFVGGMGMLGRGFAYWRRRPGLMALGLVPAAIVGLLFLGGLVTLGAFLPAITEAMTPFADGWPGVWVTVLRLTVGTALLGAALILVAVTFTALTLVVGEPFYDRIWRAVETDLGSTGLDARYGFWRSVGDAVSLIARGVLVALLAALVALIPVVGGVLGPVVGVLLTGRLLADELTSRALTARGLAPAARRKLGKGRRARLLGFGVATQLCFLVPLGAVASMPAAVAGATLLARSLLDDAASAAHIRA
ncbi:EI24 domain-containing protein [Microbacterium sp. M3]|uniref:EI24 domain-containing protein n=1 Tax=Microbacterium arthrosphaerae TaxID=792652 RepID=A0ABU4GVU7_9MICO|nr:MULTISPECIES: EI24 domain-containing protein [Microbacterium]MDW4571193.1 EI24 domain-containing protein [Microbacterium arthrosphaerae]MDW7605048.1 EI24 domain-containing protein [Microbacterium sp. M3]